MISLRSCFRVTYQLRQNIFHLLLRSSEYYTNGIMFDRDCIDFDPISFLRSVNEPRVGSSNFLSGTSHSQKEPMRDENYPKC